MAKSLDWEHLGFAYTPTDWRFVATWKDGAWDRGTLSADPNVTMSECADVLQYAQTGFEGLKVYRTVEGKVVTFRPDLNDLRLQDTCHRLLMPALPEGMFLDALDEVVRANLDWVPPYGSGATLYVRPVVFGIGPKLGVGPADAYQFRMFCSPVGPYFKGGEKPIRLMVSSYDRAAPHGTGHIKAGLNYAMSLYPGMLAHQLGYNENLFLDSATRTYVEETGGANFVFITKDGTLVTPQSPTILPSITRRSIVYVAEHYLGMKVEERRVRFDELKDFAEAGVCGTAAVICPIGMIHGETETIAFPSGMDHAGPFVARLYDTLTGIQMGRIPAPAGWLHEIQRKPLRKAGD